MDLGIEPFLISDSLVAVMAQRLVRGICRECKAPDSLSPQILKRLPQQTGADSKSTFWKGVGCEACNYTGYSGRMGLFEVMTITPSLKELIESDVHSANLKKAAQREGFRSMSMDGIRKALKGLTTIDEVFRVAPPDAGEVQKGHTVEPPAPEEIETEELPSLDTRSSLSMVRPRKILVVDDNEIILKVLGNILESEDYLVITAENGLEAMKLAITEKPDLMITDFLMPKMDGVTLIKKLKSQLATRYIPIIMLTAKDEVDSEVRGMDAGADDYLTKPVNPKRLLTRIHRLLERPGIGEM
jgi:CheY-like chemotaxis protein